MLTLQFVPYIEIENLTSAKRINKLLKIVKDNKIILLEGRLRKVEETELIEKTMEEINEKFTGVELAVINPAGKENQMIRKVKHAVVNLLLGNRLGFTVIGPANIVKEIKQDPNKIQLLINESKKKRRGKS